MVVKIISLKSNRTLNEPTNISLYVKIPKLDIQTQDQNISILTPMVFNQSVNIVTFLTNIRSKKLQILTKGHLNFCYGHDLHFLQTSGSFNDDLMIDTVDKI